MISFEVVPEERMGAQGVGLAPAADETGEADPVIGSPGPAGAVSAPFFEVLGARPMLGRTFRADEVIPGKHRVVIVTHRLWRDRLSANREIVGQTISLSGVPYEVIGVLPPTFEFPDDTLELVAVTAADERSATVTALTGKRFSTSDRGATWTAVPEF